jgi:hypothetical protein
MTIEEHFENNKEIIADLEQKHKDRDIICGPYTLKHDIHTLENGIYRKTGFLELPFCVEIFDDASEFYTHFSIPFFKGEGVIDSDYTDCGKGMDSASFENNYGSDFQSIMEQTERGDILDGMNSLIVKYFDLRKKVIEDEVLKSEIANESSALIMKCYTEF